ncbi:MAG: ATP-binding protein [Agitococcus sp.]|nr:ATP-binding protein [Agitococcus sp.]
MNSTSGVATSHVKLTFESRLANIGMVGAVTRILSSESGFGIIPSAEIELAVIEAVTNVIKYGLAALPTAEVELSFCCFEQYFVIEIVDLGIPIPPHILAAADGSVFNFSVDDMDAWPTSGMGISLIKAVMDQVEYSSVNGRNSLRLIKLFEQIDASEKN